MKIIPYESSLESQIVKLMADFRVTLSSFKNVKRNPNLIIAKEELCEYLSNNFPIFIAIDNQGILHGYIVCRIQDQVVWAESIYVKHNSRKQGIASKLYLEAEKIAVSLNSDTVYNWVHPNNTKIIPFLKSRGYNVLNLIELRKPHLGENLSMHISILDNVFDY
ncbi:hypothetical protein NEF87_003093 [Candidatus Lokiarchaeum ossiferum]|uniref:N-acetyltransferase domain-containing protein n=1 Tax=Candidatus Lokiarchaeum ossiferum TaxID=2951803 RepID=A0ABY6HTH1_9ARCH|nr:hypothetical protein NEF87_003093 [Candidatus Lokiarchaeum sp. B-35]